MFRIESYITSIILSNADRYIKNFRKEDAQVSLWEGDATFHNIELNVDALNEGFRSVFVFCSGYIRDLTIHVPWTKLVSEPVTISVNTIECVMKLKSKEDICMLNKKKKESKLDTEHKCDNEDEMVEEIIPPSSYSTALTTKIMNNLSIRCKNIILKLVDEDIVLSMNIEKLNFDNVNEEWIQSITDFTVEKLLTRKAVTLSGVTICLDEQNSSGRIDTYLVLNRFIDVLLRDGSTRTEPLLYRSLISIRILRCYNRAVSRKPIYTHIDIFSDEMFFTVCEPQLPMLIKLAILFYNACGQDHPRDLESSPLMSENEPHSDESDTVNMKTLEEIKHETSWSSWLWNMIPTILPQETDNLFQNKEINPTFHIGFCVKNLGLDLKVLTSSTKKKSKRDFRNFFKSSYSGCSSHLNIKSGEWFNVQFGVSQVSVEIPVDEAGSNSKCIPFFSSGSEGIRNFIQDTLFDEKFDFFALKMHQNMSYSASNPSFDGISEAFEYSNFDFMYAIDFSMDTHLNLFTEDSMLQKTSGCAIDYVHAHTKPKTTVFNSSDEKMNDSAENSNFVGSSEVHPESVTQIQKIKDETTLLRIVFGSVVLKINAEIINRMIYVSRITSYFQDLPSYRTSVTGNEDTFRESKGFSCKHTTQLTIFNFTVELHASLPGHYSPNLSKKECQFTFNEESNSSEHLMPVLMFRCKCIDSFKKLETADSATSTVDWRKIISVKAVDVSCNLLHTDQSDDLLKCEKFDTKIVKDLEGDHKEFNLEIKNSIFTSSKPNLLLSYYIMKYFKCCIWQLENKQKICTNIFYTSLIDDASVVGNPVLQIDLNKIILTSKLEAEAFVVEASVQGCRVCVSKMQTYIPKKVVIFTTDESNSESSRIQVIIQHCRNHVQDCIYPRCIWFNFSNLKCNLDLVLYDWIFYEPTTNLRLKCHSKAINSVREQSVSNRKISDASSGSYNRKYIIAYPKPKESVHSSSETEMHSPLDVTNTETSDLFFTAENISVVNRPKNTIQRLVNNVEFWSDVIIFGEISCITVYVPAGGTLFHNVTQSVDKEQDQNNEEESNPEVLKFHVKCLKLKCDLPSNISEELNSHKLISFPKDVWFKGKLTSPLTVSINEFSVATLVKNGVPKHLLKPLNMACTIGVSLRPGSKNESIVALCVHFDFQPISVCINENQIRLISALMSAVKFVSRVSKNTTPSESNFQERNVSVITEKSDNDYEAQNRFTGWIQWTFSKCSLTFYSELKDEFFKLSMIAEDSMVSLEFNEIFHKFKVKVASFGTYHYKRYVNSKLWQNGPFYGTIVQKCYNQPIISNKMCEEDVDDRFLSATITRARSSNLKTRFSLSTEVSDLAATSNRDHFITEVIIKLCPIDVVIPLMVADKFLSILKSSVALCRSISRFDHGENANCEPVVPFTSLPLVYFDMTVLRIFVPTSTVNSECPYSCDTLVCEIGPVHADCHPKNPIMRKHLNPEVYYIISGQKHTSMEQKLQNQQYQIEIMDSSFYTGVWNEIEQMLIKEQIQIEEPPSVLEQNPAVMWNQGCHPGTKNKIALKYRSPLTSKFTSLFLVAPAIECFSLKTAVYGAYFEADILTSMSVTVSLHQIPFLFALYKEYVNYVYPHFKEVEIESAGMVSSKISSSQLRSMDSGIESLEQSSVGSSSVSKVKNYSQIAFKHRMTSKTGSPHLFPKLSNSAQVPASTFRNEIFKEIYITAQNINLILYSTSEITQNTEKRLQFKDMLLFKIVQPYILISNENSYAAQLGIFALSGHIPNSNSSHGDTPCPTLGENTIYKKFLDLKTLKYCSYTKIKNDSFMLKANRGLNKKWKIDCNVGQPVFIDCETDTVRIVKASMDILCETCGNSLQSFRENLVNKNKNEEKIINRMKGLFSSVTNIVISTSHVFAIFDPTTVDRSLLLNVSQLKVNAKSSPGTKSSWESIVIQSELKSVLVSFPMTRSDHRFDVLSCDNLSNAGLGKENIVTNLLLNPCNVTMECWLTWQKWNLFKDSPWKCMKISSDNVIFNLNPANLRALSAIYKNYKQLVENLLQHSNTSENRERKTNEDNEEYYKDDLRAGAFQFVQRNAGEIDQLSAYEIISCNREIQPYICWKYPQPRALSKLQIYPVPIEDFDDQSLEYIAHCELQYYCEIEKCFYTYASFGLSQNTIQNVALPVEKPQIVTCECWRIVLFDTDNNAQNLDSRINVKLLAGCIRVDTVFQPSLIARLQILITVDEVQLNFSTLNQSSLMEHDTFADVPEIQLFASVAVNNIKAFLSDYDSEKTVKLQAVSRVNLLNYEYLMLQSFIDPFFSEIIYHAIEGSPSKLASIVKNIHLRISPSFIHTMTVAHHLWNNWAKNTELRKKITAPYIISNNTNLTIEFYQEKTPYELRLHLPSFYNRLYAWYNPVAPKIVSVTLLTSKKKFTSKPFEIKKVGCRFVTCVNDDQETCFVFVSVAKPSSVIHEVIISGSFQVCNLTHTAMDMCVISYGKDAEKSKLSSAQMVAQTSISGGQLQSVVLPLNQKLSFKVRYSSVGDDDVHGQWSGLIPLAVSQKQHNQTSWMVKIPLKRHKEHFQSFWCQLSWEICEGLPKFLAVFRPLCSVKSFLPMKCFVRILNDLGSPISSNVVLEKGASTDLFIPDTVSLDKYKAEYSPMETFETCSSQVKFEKRRVREKPSEAVTIQSLINEIKSEQENNNWPFLNADTRLFNWKTEHVHDMKPIINISRQEEKGCGTNVEIYPWAILVNTSNQPVLLNISDVIYKIDACEIIVPPSIVSTFKLGLVENGDYFWSGSLQLVDDVNPSISKITGRIPINGFVTVSIDSGTFITFLNITSKNYGDMRILNVCSSYVISNNSSLSVNCSAWVVCRSGNNVSMSFDIPSELTKKSINLPVTRNPSIGQAVMKWYKMGGGDVQVLPYLILCVDDNIACPIRIYDLSEKQQYPVTFSSSKSCTKLDHLPCTFLTAQHIDGQIFLTIWEETTPHVTIHNMSQLPLNVISSKSEEEIEGISYCPDWNWKFYVVSESIAHFHIRKPIYEKDEKQVEYLMFSIQNNKHIKQTKWSLGVPLKPCVNQLVLLPLSQHHIKLGIFRNAFTYVVWIQSATANELSAKVICTKLTDSFLSVSDAVSQHHSKNEDNVPENICDIPDQLMELYNADTVKFSKLNIFIEAFSLTLSYDDEFSFNERDMTSFHATNVALDFNSIRKQNEVTEDILCKISVEGYQVDNEEYYLHTYDFPVVLLCKPDSADIAALGINISLKVNNLLSNHMWDVEFFVNSPSVFLEDKYLSKLKVGVQSIFSAVVNSSNFKSNESVTYNHEMTKQKTAVRIPSISYSNLDTRVDCILPVQAKSSCSKSVNLSDCDTDDKTSSSSIKVESNVKSEDGVKGVIFLSDPDGNKHKRSPQISYIENQNYCIIPDTIVERSKTIARPLQLRKLYISSFNMTVSLRTSTTFYIALDRSPLKFSEFKKEYLTTSPFELGNLLIVHYFMGAVYGTGWAISSLEFVGSPGVLARDVGTGIKDFVSMPLYGIASGPRGFVLGIAHGSASLMKHIMTGTLSSVTNFAGSWARTLNRFTLDADDLLQSEQIRRMPPSNIAEGVLQGLSEFGIGLLGGIGGIAHHPLQYAVSNTENRSLINSISLGIVGVLTRPISGAAELVAKTGQGILSHVGWKVMPIQSGSSKAENFSSLQICTLKHRWANNYENVLFTVEAVDARNIGVSLWVILTPRHLHIKEVTNGCGRSSFDLQTHEFADSDDDPTLIVVKKSLFNYKNTDDFSTARICRFINETNRSLNINSPYSMENLSYVEKSESVYNFCVNPVVKSSLLNFIVYQKYAWE